jgi:HD superfamily phosphohydrolase
MDEFHFKRVTDPIYGTFGVSELEVDIISTSAFQRLHNVKQLGLAHLVYPGAGYSRFSHSLGACHVAGRMMRAINLNAGTEKYDKKQVQLYRLAGLLHDIGHYPFSHATETAALNHYKPQQFLEMKTEGPEQQQDTSTPPAYHHEVLGRVVIESDPGIAKALAKHNFKPDELRAVFSRESPDVLSNLVSSDLDCDRMDYLLRTAHAAGLPYGEVDVEYLTSQACVDSEGHLCLTKKAARAADHFLVSRYFDYTQVVFHKTLVGLEEVLKDVIATLFERGHLKCSGAEMKEMITSGKYAGFDDQYLIHIIRQAEAGSGLGDEVFKRKALCVLNRDCPKLVANSDRLSSRDESEEKHHRLNKSHIQEKIAGWAKHFGIDEKLWHLWARSLSLSKIGSTVSVGAAQDEGFDEERQQIVRILTTSPKDAKSQSKPLIDHEFALLRQLANSRLYCIRLYVHLPEDCKNPSKLKSEIAAKIKSDLPDFPLTA